MLRSLGLISLVALAGPALADGIDYNYIEAGYYELDLDDSIIDVDGDGINIIGSFEVGESMFVRAEYATADLDFGVDLDELYIGLGVHTPIGNNADFFGIINYVSLEASAFGLSEDDDGFGATVGVRSMVTDTVELAGQIEYIDLSDSGDDTSFGGSAWYYFSDNFSVGLTADFSDDITRYGLGARLFFGQ
ncbi:MAG: hypothetical protein QNI99_13680 [Woeseiaceae bacterium]|nr:hypothetical protein [Woeseiaceae bacterium]